MLFFFSVLFLPALDFSIFLLEGMTRLLVVSSILFATIGAELVIYAIELGVVTEFRVQFFVPEWLDFGVIKLFFHAVETLCLFYMCFWASRRFVRRDESKNELHDHLLSQKSAMDDEHIPLAYQV